MARSASSGTSSVEVFALEKPCKEDARAAAQADPLRLRYTNKQAANEPK
jgi:hypothetical protein